MCEECCFINQILFYPDVPSLNFVCAILVILANIGQDSQYRTIIGMPILQFYIFVRMRNFITYFERLFFFFS